MPLQSDPFQKARQAPRRIARPLPGQNDAIVGRRGSPLALGLVSNVSRMLARMDAVHWDPHRSIPGPSLPAHVWPRFRLFEDCLLMSDVCLCLWVLHGLNGLQDFFLRKVVSILWDVQGRARLTPLDAWPLHTIGHAPFLPANVHDESPREVAGIR